MTRQLVDHARDHDCQTFVKARGDYADGCFKDQITEQRLPHAERFDVGHVGCLQARNGEGVGEFIVLMCQRIRVDQRLEFDGGLSLINRTLEADTGRRCCRIEQSTTRAGERAIDLAFEYAVEQLAWLVVEPLKQFKLFIIVREARPSHLGHQVGVGVAPWLLHRLLAAQHGDRFEGGESLTLPIVGEAEFTAP